MNVNNLKVIVAVTAAMLFTSISVRAFGAEYVRQISGEITWIDTKLGKLQLKNDKSPDKGEIMEYRINKNDTRVTNPVDNKFITIDDLQPGQHVTVDVFNNEDDKVVQKITADPRPASEFQEAYGEIVAVDAAAGTFSLAERPKAGEEGKSNLSNFVFEPKDIIVMHSPSIQPVPLELKPGDVVRVDYVVKDGKRWAHSITIYSPYVTSTTTTTTTTTTTQ